jgi:hypothetical protein
MQIIEKRSGISRFEGSNQFSDKDLLEVLKALVPHMEGGKINLDAVDSISVTEKLDSNYSGFGINQEGKFFLESSNSGEVTIDEYKTKFSFITDFYASFESLLNNKKFQATLKAIYAKVGPIKFEAEMFPTLTHTGDELGDVVFIGTRYNKNKLGEEGAFMIFRSLLHKDGSWINTPNDTNIKLIKLMKSADTKSWRIYYIQDEGRLSGEIKFDISGIEDLIKDDSKYEDALEILSSSSRKIEKAHLKNVLSLIRPKLQGVLNQYANEIDSILGSKGRSPVEGVVMTIQLPDGDFINVKGTSEVFNDFKKKTWRTRSFLMELKNNLDEKIIKDVIGLRSAQPAALNRDIAKAAEGASSVDEIVSNLLKISGVKEPDFKAALPIIQETLEALVGIKEDFEQSKGDIDPDSLRKSLSDIEYTEKKLEVLLNSIKKSNSINDIAKVVLSHRLEKVSGISESQIVESMYEEVNVEVGDDESMRTPVIIWSGRAQPWHKGHDSLIQFAKSKLSEVGAEKVLIIPVAGKESDNSDMKKNPLNTEERIDVFTKVYSSDNLVIVSQEPAKGGYIGTLAEISLNNNCFIVGWAMGSDRKDSYLSQIKTVNKFIDKVKEESPDDFNPNKLNIQTDDTGHVNDNILLVLNREESEKDSEDPELYFKQLVEKVKSSKDPVIPTTQMSGTVARNLAYNLDFDDWYKEVVPTLYKNNPQTKQAYEYTYNKLIEASKIVADSPKITKKVKKSKKTEGVEYIIRNILELNENTNQPSETAVNDNIDNIIKGLQSTISIDPNISPENKEIMEKLIKNFEESKEINNPDEKAKEINKLVTQMAGAGGDGNEELHQLLEPVFKDTAFKKLSGWFKKSKTGQAISHLGKWLGLAIAAQVANKYPAVAMMGGLAASTAGIVFKSNYESAEELNKAINDSRIKVLKTYDTFNKHIEKNKIDKDQLLSKFWSNEDEDVKKLRTDKGKDSLQKLIAISHLDSIFKAVDEIAKQVYKYKKGLFSSYHDFGKLMEKATGLDAKMLDAWINVHLPVAKKDDSKLREIAAGPTFWETRKKS